MQRTPARRSLHIFHDQTIPPPIIARCRYASPILFSLGLMTDAADEIEVSIGGGVRAQGSYRLTPPATIASGLAAAGGLAAATPEMRPADTVTVRRPLGDRKVDVFRFSLSESPASWQDFRLSGGDFVTFQWHIEPEKT